MADIVNLRMHRKRRTRAEKEQKAQENRALFGRTRAERRQAQAEDTLAERRLDGHRRDHPHGKP